MTPLGARAYYACDEDDDLSVRVNTTEIAIMA